jgi:serine/threonine protein kinase
MRPVTDEVVQRLRGGAEPDLEGTKYRLVSLIGRGGMGTVYLAEDTELRRDVALKVTTDRDLGGALEARFRREAQVLARLEHPAIVPVHDVGVLADGRAYYAMKLVRGKRLDAWLLEAPGRPAALRLFQRICEAVAFAHANDVIHRDLKPENVMVGAFGEALVMDWGLAKELRRGAASSPEAAPPADRDADDGALADTVHALDAGGDTVAGSVMGTPAYMAPEQARGEIARLDERTDVFALGAILYFVLSGREPFRGPSAAEVLRKVIGEEPPPLDGVEPPLASIVARAMRKEASGRYASAREMAADVGRFLDALPVLAHRETLAERAARVARKYQIVLFLLAAYLVMRAVILLAFRR